MKTLAPDDPRHGTYNGYHNYGCRCAPCRNAHTDYWRVAAHKSGRHRPRAEYLAELATRPIPHGTETGYKRCRCDRCRAASAAARRRRRRAA